MSASEGVGDSWKFDSHSFIISHENQKEDQEVGVRIRGIDFPDFHRMSKRVQPHEYHSSCHQS